MIEIRYKDYREFTASGLSGKPTMNNNCYYIAGKSATFNDNRPGSTLNAGLAAWKTHIGGDNGSIEVNPNLNANYIPTNTQCVGMGIPNPLIVGVGPGSGTPEILPETFTYISDGILHIESPVAETVQGYSIIGTILFTIQKSEGKVSFPINPSKGTIIIIRGSSGWTKKLSVQ
jgi:hypothetical protein